MAGSFKDALSKSGLVPPEAPAPKPVTKRKMEWNEPLPEDDGRAHVPFDAPAVTKVKEGKKP